MYDVIVIGAGLSGISAGIRLSYYGQRVRILEKHRLPGGMNGYYDYRGRTIDVGLHAMTNFAPPEQRSAPLNRLMRQLRLRREELDLQPQTFSEIVFPRQTLRFDNDFASFTAQIAEFFPEDSAGFQQLYELICRTDSFSPSSPLLSTRAILRRHLKSPLLQDMLLCPMMLYGNSQVGDMDFNQFCILFQSIFVEGLGRPRHGMKPFITYLLQRFTELGGELSLGVGVASLVTSGNQITEVITTDGEVLRAKKILSCAGALETARLCSEPPPEMSQWPPGEISFCETLFDLKCPPRELGLDACIIFRNCQEQFVFEPPAEEVDLTCQILCMPGNYHNCDQISDAQTVRLSVLASPRWWHSVSPKSYRATKEKVVGAQIKMMDEWKPGFAAAVTDWEMFSPKTIERFTGRCHGAIYGSPRKMRAGVSPELENLVVCGTDQGFLGIVGALISGVAMTNVHLL